MKNKISSPSKKEPWIPPPARTTKSLKIEKNKTPFDPTSINLHFNHKFNLKKDQYHSDLNATQLQMNQTNDKLVALDIAQKLSFERSRQRLEELQEVLQNDEFGEGAEFKHDKSPERLNTDQRTLANGDVEEQRQNLVYKLRDFEANSIMLRNLLKDTQNKSITEILSRPFDKIHDAPFISKHEDQIEILDKEDTNLQTSSEMNQACGLHDKKIEILEDTVKNLQVENQKLLNMKKNQDDNRAHMQRALHRQEANYNRLKTQLKTPDTEFITQDQISQNNKEIELLKLNFAAEKETLKRVLKLEKRKSAKNAEIIDVLRSKVSAKTNQLKEVECERNNYKIEVENLVQIRTLAESELSILRERVGELETLIENIGSDKNFQKNCTSNHRAHFYQNNSDDVQSSSNINDTQKEKTIKEQKEISSSVNRLNFSEDFSNYCKNEMTNQLDDQSQNILKLTSKVEQQAKQIKNLSEHTNCSPTEKLQYENRIEALNKKIEITEQKNFEISLQLAKCEEALKNTELRLNEKTQFFAESSKKLECDILDSKHEIEILREKLLTVEKQNHIHLSETQTELSRKNMEVEQIRQLKKEMEETLTAKLSDLKNRVDHSQNTNRSLQNYITFLKNSYATVFSDPALSTLSTPSKIN